MANLEDVRRRSPRRTIALSLKSRPRLTRFAVWLPAIVFLLLLLAWEIAARNGRLSALLFPAPTVIGARLVRLLGNGELLNDLGVTGLRMGIGFAVGCGLGTTLGLLMGWSRLLRAAVDPVIAAFHPLPKITLFPLIMVFFGIGETSKLVIIAIACFFPMVVSAAAGVRQISPIHFEVAQNYGASRWNTFKHVVFPGSVPLLLNGLRLAFNTALLSVITVEIISASQGLGAMIWLAWETLRTEDLYVALFVIAVFGVVANRGLRSLAARLAPWQADKEI